MRNTSKGMHQTFDDVLWIVCGLGMVIGLIALIGSGKVWDEIGKNGLLMERDDSRGEQTLSPASRAERDIEIRQMLEARNARRARRGEDPIDIEAELRRLTAPVMDDGLRAEIRDMVIARNARRARRGEPPLEVEAEVAREIERLSAL